MNTKERILYNSLDLFSENSYEGVSMRNIAKCSGIKGSSIYNHFYNKEMLFDSVVTKFSDVIENKTTELTKPYLDKITDEDFSDSYFTNSLFSMFDFLLRDSYSLKLRKLLLLERFRNKKASRIYEKLYVNDILNYTDKIMCKTSLKDKITDERYLLSLYLCSPLFLLFLKFDTVSDDELTTLKRNLLIFKQHYLQGS